MCSRFSYCHGGGGYLSLYFLAERQEIKGRQSSLGWLYILTLGKPRPIRTSSRLDVVYGICQRLPSDILSIYIIIYFNEQYWLYTWYFILYAKKIGGFFNICCSFMLCNTLYTAVSVWSIIDITSFRHTSKFNHFFCLYLNKSSTYILCKE